MNPEKGLGVGACWGIFIECSVGKDVSTRLICGKS